MISPGRAPRVAQAVDYCRLAWIVELLCDTGRSRLRFTACCGPCDRLSSSPAAPPPRESLAHAGQQGAQHERPGADDRKDGHGCALDADPAPRNPIPKGVGISMPQGSNPNIRKGLRQAEGYLESILAMPRKAAPVSISPRSCRRSRASSAWSNAGSSAIIGSITWPPPPRSAAWRRKTRRWSSGR